MMVALVFLAGLPAAANCITNDIDDYFTAAGALAFDNACWFLRP
jgi:hypothetical protein